MKRILKLLTSRVAFVGLFMVLQICVIVGMLTYFRARFAYFYYIFIILSILVVVHLLNKDGNPAYKIAWIIPIVLLPIFGVPLYFMFAKQKPPKRLRLRMSGIQERSEEALESIGCPAEAYHALPPDAARQSDYLRYGSAMPLCSDTETRYFPVGDDMFPAMLEELRRAERYIFLEYFIIAPGVMWDQILAVLEEKVAAGVDVRVIYDDMGSISTLPSDYAQTLEQKGIRCHVFHRFQPVLNGSFNNRDHRKILVVDGKAAFTGGINLADEYINQKMRFGHWLDCGVMLRGKGAYSFTVMFLSMWDYLDRTEDNFIQYRPSPEEFSEFSGRGFVQPYSDSPTDEEYVGENAYLNMIERAKDYIYICTPYLVIDSDMITALTKAAKSGVDVRIITPGIPDKWYVYQVTRSYYAGLLKAGIKIYEYTPGFIHSKTCVSDDKYAICGTINFDYRSLYLHHECAVWMYETPAVGQMKESYVQILEHCTQITPAFCARRRLPQRILQSLLRVFAPLM